MEPAPHRHGGPGQSGPPLQCFNGFPPAAVERAVRQNPDLVASRAFNSIVLIPDMEFTCNGTIARVIVAGIMLDHNGSEQGMKLQIWRRNKTEPGKTQMFYRVDEIEIELPESDSMCEEVKLETKTQNQRPCVSVFTLTEPNLSDSSVNVQSGDILGLELPHNADFKLYSVAKCRVTTYAFPHTNVPSAINLELLNGSKRDTTRPLVGIEVNDNENPGI